MSPDVGLLRSVFSKHFMSLNRVIMLMVCLLLVRLEFVLEGGVAWFLVFSFGFWSQFCEDCC